MTLNGTTFWSESFSLEEKSRRVLRASPMNHRRKCGSVSVVDQSRRKKDSSLSKKNDFATARKVARSTTGLERDIPPAATLLNVQCSVYVRLFVKLQGGTGGLSPGLG